VYSNGASGWAALSDNEIFTLYSNLTFYFPSAPDATQLPQWQTLYPNGRNPSHPYAGTVCDCLHVQLTECQTFSPTATCNYWPVSTYLNMAWVESFSEGFPSNVWFEGLSFPGEWAFPLSCNNPNIGQGVYGFNNHIWLYPITGFGVWWNTGNTAWGYNKVDWIIRNGVGQSANGVFLGNTPLEVMTTLAETVCPGFQNMTTTQCISCPYSATGSHQCCCHGAGYNLGTQILQIQQQNGGTLQSAIQTVMGYYQTGMYGQDGMQSYSYPVGTAFSYRDLLDPTFMSLQQQLGFESVQFIREPQHSGGSGTPSTPAYSFEFLMQNPSWNYNWQTFCSSQELAVINPLNFIDSYTSQGYIVNPPNPQDVSTWTPTATFASIFQLNMNAYLATDEGTVVTIKDNSGSNSGLIASIVVPLIVGIALLAAGAVVIYRRSGHVALTSDIPL